MMDFPPTTLRDLRVSYDLDSLTEDSAPAEPYALFNAWLQDALKHHLPEPNAMTLATLGQDGGPSARTVLLKGFDEQGFHFFTNYDSRKGHEIAADARASAVFLWTQRHHQVSIRGTITKLPRGEAESYFAARPRGHQIGAWVSEQSRVIPGREWLEQRQIEMEQRFAEPVMVAMFFMALPALRLASAPHVAGAARSSSANWLHREDSWHSPFLPKGSRIQLQQSGLADDDEPPWPVEVLHAEERAGWRW
jgi:pyridoxamine 5'-phosphate oxidase